MGIQDRDEYRDYYRGRYRSLDALRRKERNRSNLRVSLICIFIVLALFAFFKHLPGFHWPGTEAAWQARPIPPPSALQPERNASVPRPIPEYAPMPIAPAAPNAIYRCGNSYSSAPCSGGREISSPAAGGFDSRPSEHLARMVADQGGSQESFTAVIPAGDKPAAEHAYCELYARQIRDIDADARNPHPAWIQDQLRETRRDIQTSIRRLHCHLL